MGRGSSGVAALANNYIYGHNGGVGVVDTHYCHQCKDISCVIYLIIARLSYHSTAWENPPDTKLLEGSKLCLLQSITHRIEAPHDESMYGTAIQKTIR